MEKLLEVKNLKVSFFTDLGETKAVKNAGFELEKGDFFGIVGESGSGKSVTTKSILKLGTSNCVIKEGEVLFEGRDILKLSGKELREVRGKEIAMIFQDSLSALNPVYTVGSKMVELIRRHNKVGKQEAERQALELLTAVGIADPAKAMRSYPHELSGGMRQRVMIAMAMSSRPKILIADEPTTALDVTIQAQILHLLLELQRKNGMSIILITHDLGVVAQTCSRVAVMCGGYIVEEGTAEEIFLRPKHPYTRALIASMPRVGGGSFEQFLERDLSDQADSLCPFLNRCKYVEECCRKTLPEYYLAGEKHRVRCHRREEEV
ncbi:MAG: ABC transporter ATP-binding protein [Lachnospiraceae bacterium]|nr:ABC transporter ATP-binding protein [Lachnospiraceae bacterium]